MGGSPRPAELRDVPEETLDALLVGLERTDAMVQRDWGTRYEHPRQWHHRVDYIEHKLHEMLSRRIDQNATDDREAVAYAVRGGSRTPPPAGPPDYAHMSESEFRRRVIEDHGFDPGR